MKKILNIISIFILITTFLISAKKNSAADLEGNFRCQWNSSTNTCEGPISNTCKSGYVEGDCSAAEQVNGMPVDQACNTIEFPCIEDTTPPEESTCKNIGESCINNPCCGNLVCAPNIDSSTPICQQCEDVYSAEECGGFTVNENLSCDGEGSINTAVGCISITNITSFLTTTTLFALGIGGGIFILVFSYGAFLIMTSEGDPRKYKTGQEIIVSAIAGVIFMIFAVLIIKIFKIDLFGI
jgi:hypothetical protein